MAQDTRLAVHLFRGRAATPPLLLPGSAGCQVEEQTGGDPALSAGDAGDPASPVAQPERVAVDAATQVTPQGPQGGGRGVHCGAQVRPARPNGTVQTLHLHCGPVCRVALWIA